MTRVVSPLKISPSRMPTMSLIEVSTLPLPRPEGKFMEPAIAMYALMVLQVIVVTVVLMFAITAIARWLTDWLVGRML